MRVESAQAVAVPKSSNRSRHGHVKKGGGIGEATQQSPARPIVDINWKCEQSKLIFQKWEVFSRVGSGIVAQDLAVILGCQNPARN